MKFKVQYLKPKKKQIYTEDTATFYNIEDAEFWAKMIGKQGCKDIKILPVF
jgi:hypothetical protein